MSAGDIDDRLGPAAELERLVATHKDLREYLAWARDNIEIRRADVPFAAGISLRGNCVYVHPDLDCNIDNIDCTRAIATHEFTEWALRTFCQIGMDYAEDPRGHRLANRAEYTAVNQLLNSNADSAEGDAEAWTRYDDHIDPQIRRIEKLPLTSVPKDLALYPYEDDEAMLRKIKEAQR